MRGGKESEYGPGWYDVRTITDSVERWHHCTVVVRMTVVKSDRAPWTHHVVVEAVPRNGDLLQRPLALVWGAYPTVQHKNFPALLYALLIKLDAKLEEAANAAQPVASS